MQMWRNCVLVRFHISIWRIVDVRVHRSNRIGGKQYPLIMGGVDIIKHMQGGFHVTRRRFIAVGGKERVSSDEVRARRMSKPANASDKALVCVLAMFEGRRLIIFSGWSNSVNGNTGTVRCCCRSLIPFQEMETPTDLSVQ
jgi:hypothetical protein